MEKPIVDGQVKDLGDPEVTTATLAQPESAPVEITESVSDNCPPRADRHWLTRVAAGKPVPPQYAEIAERVESVLAQAVEDLGGPDTITAQQRVVLETERIALTILGLGECYLQRFGILDGKKRPRNVLKMLAPYLNSARCAASVLGLDRVPRRVASVEQVVRDIVAKRKPQEKEVVDGFDKT
jgi:hypothetical protein